MKKGWELKKLGEVLIIERGGSPRPIEKYITNSPNGLNWIKISDATASDKYIYETKEKITRDGLHKTRVVNEGDFILSNSMSFGRPYIMKTSGCIHDGWLVLRQNGKKLFETEFLFYLLSSPFVFNQFNELAAGSTVRNLNIALVSSVTVPIPPLPEQLRIVSQLDDVFALISKAKANAEQNLKNARELFESYLNAVFTRKGKDWKEKPLNEVCLIVNGGTPDTKIPKYWNGKHLWITPKDMGQLDCYYVNDTSRKITDAGLKNSSAKLLPPDSIILSSRAPIGHLAINKKPISTNQGCKGLIPKKDISTLFLFYFLKQSVELLNSLGTGATFRELSSSKLGEVIIPVPRSLNEQLSIVKKLDDLSTETNKLEAIYHQKLNDLEELKKSILHKAFNGELKPDSL